MPVSVQLSREGYLPTKSRGTLRPHYELPVPRPYPRQPGDNHWQVESKDGLASLYGTPKQVGNDPAALTKPGDARCIFAWKLTETRDPFGNRICYEYEADTGERGNQSLLKRIRYVDYGDPSDRNLGYENTTSPTPRICTTAFPCCSSLTSSVSTMRKTPTRAMQTALTPSNFLR